MSFSIFKSPYLNYQIIYILVESSNIMRGVKMGVHTIFTPNWGKTFFGAQVENLDFLCHFLANKQSHSRVREHKCKFGVS